MNILAIETSCDETACAIVRDGVKELASVIATSAEIHQITGGVVPEIAARKQLESIVPVIEACVNKAKVDPKKEINAIAVTVGPGLIGSLVVGVAAAKSLSIAWNKPLIPVNHLVGHIYGNFVNNPSWAEIEFPAVVLIVSGGHTDLVLMQDHEKFEYLGGTVDDAAGEAFDKVARLVGLAKYLGGIQVSTQAALCENNILHGLLPRPMLDQDNFDFSFSGLKTAVKKLVDADGYPVSAICREFEEAVCTVLVSKTLKAVKKYNAKSLLLGGGVSANTRLREQFQEHGASLGVPVYIPPLNLCGDNAVYIASAAYFKYSGAYKAPRLSAITADPSLSVMDLV